jgi:hypothetical protein
VVTRIVEEGDRGVARNVGEKGDRVVIRIVGKLRRQSNCRRPIDPVC